MVQVLKGLDLSVEKGELVSIVGSSGSGKTTLLRILGTLLSADSGTYLLEGVPVPASTDALYGMRNQKIGFMFQDHRLLPQLTALENILLPVLASQSKVSAERTERAIHLMRLMDIDKLRDKMPDTLSGGESSRVALCRALIMNPALLLADEPTGQLDPVNALNVAEVLEKVSRSLSATVIMVTHSLEIARRADRILTLKDGILQ